MVLLHSLDQTCHFSSFQMVSGPFDMHYIGTICNPTFKKPGFQMFLDLMIKFQIPTELIFLGGDREVPKLASFHIKTKK